MQAMKFANDEHGIPPLIADVLNKAQIIEAVQTGDQRKALDFSRCRDVLVQDA